MNRNQLQIQDVHFSYHQGEEVLQGITIEFDQRITAIIGGNGGGKTTLMKLIKGLLTPTAGSILYNGLDIANVSVAQLAKDIGLVFQNPNDQLFQNTVREEVLFGPLQIGMSRERAVNEMVQALELVGLSHELETNPYDLGLSERKLVAMASILAMDPNVIVLDEPTIAQDYMGKKRIGNIIRELHEKGKQIIVILHDMDLVAELVERVLVLADGKVLIDDEPRVVFSKRELLEMAHVEQPSITKLGYELGYEQVFLTMEELRQRYYSNNE